MLLISTLVTTALAGCVTQPEVATQQASPIFDRQRTSADELPADVEANVDADTSRYAGEDSAGNRYWAARVGSTTECVVFVPADGGDRFSFCGEPGFSATTPAGRVIEFASSPSRLSPDDSENVGDTFLVNEPS